LFSSVGLWEGLLGVNITQSPYLIVDVDISQSFHVVIACVCAGAPERLMMVRLIASQTCVIAVQLLAPRDLFLEAAVCVCV